jgi:hypothetical protein
MSCFAKNYALFMAMALILCGTMFMQAAEMPHHANNSQNLFKSLLKYAVRPTLRAPSRNECFGIVGGMTLVGIGLWGYKHWYATPVKKIEFHVVKKQIMPCMTLQDQAKEYFIKQKKLEYEGAEAGELPSQTGDEFEQQCAVVYQVWRKRKHNMYKGCDSESQATLILNDNRKICYKISIKDGVLLDCHITNETGTRVVSYSTETPILAALNQVYGPPSAEQKDMAGEGPIGPLCNYALNGYGEVKQFSAKTKAGGNIKQYKLADSNLHFWEQCIKGCTLMTGVATLCEDQNAQRGMNILTLYKEYLAVQSIDPSEYIERNKQWLKGGQNRIPLRGLSAYKESVEKNLSDALYDTKFTKSGITEPISHADLAAWYSLEPKFL